MKSAFFACCAGVLLVFAGCSQGERETAFVKIDNWPMTVSYVSNRVMLVSEIHSVKSRLQKESKFAEWANSTAMQIIPGLVSERLITHELQKSGVVPEKKDIEQALAPYRKLIKVKSFDLETVSSHFGDLKDVFAEKVMNEARFRAYLRTSAGVDVSEDEIDSKIAELKSQKVRVDYRNRRAKARGASAYQELKAGTSWDAVVKKYSEDDLTGEEAADFGKVWGEFKLGGTGFPALDECLPKMKVGDYSSPLETDDGLLIVKVVDISGSEVYTLSRIMIRLLYEVEVPEERNEIKKMLFRERFNAKQIEMVKNLRKKARMEYPLGTNFTYSIWSSPDIGKQKKGLLPQDVDRMPSQ